MINIADFSINDILSHMDEQLSKEIPHSVFDPGSSAANGDHVLNTDFKLDEEFSRKIRPAAVLVPMVRYSGALNVLLTQRAEHLASHPGQISFPGGKVDETDKTPVHTALRETHEEIGIAPDHVEILGYLDNYQTATGFRILPIVGIINAGYDYELETNEVSDIFEVPFDFLMTPENHKKESARWRNRDRYFYSMPYQNRYIWGATAGIIRNLYERLYI